MKIPRNHRRFFSRSPPIPAFLHLYFRSAWIVICSLSRNGRARGLKAGDMRFSSEFEFSFEIISANCILNANLSGSFFLPSETRKEKKLAFSLSSYSFSFHSSLEFWFSNGLKRIYFSCVELFTSITSSSLEKRGWEL